MLVLVLGASMFLEQVTEPSASPTLSGHDPDAQKLIATCFPITPKQKNPPLSAENRSKAWPLFVFLVSLTPKSTMC